MDKSFGRVPRESQVFRGLLLEWQATGEPRQRGAGFATIPNLGKDTILQGGGVLYYIVNATIFLPPSLGDIILPFVVSELAFERCNTKDVGGTSANSVDTGSSS